MLFIEYLYTDQNMLHVSSDGLKKEPDSKIYSNL